MFYLLSTDAHSCVDTVNVQRQGTDQLNNNGFYIVPRSNFSCNGRIIGYMASLDQINNRRCNNPHILVWRPTNTKQTTYCIVDNYQLRNGDINRMESYYFANVSFTENNRIEFQSGDVIGYWHTIVNPCYTVWSINTTGYTSYRRNVGSNTNIDIESNSVTATPNRQPLIQVIFGMT